MKNQRIEASTNPGLSFDISSRADLLSPSGQQFLHLVGKGTEIKDCHCSTLAHPMYARIVALADGRLTLQCAAHDDHRASCLLYVGGHGGGAEKQRYPLERPKEVKWSPSMFDASIRTPAIGHDLQWGASGGHYGDFRELSNRLLAEAYVLQFRSSACSPWWRDGYEGPADLSFEEAMLACAATERIADLSIDACAGRSGVMVFSGILRLPFDVIAERAKTGPVTVPDLVLRDLSGGSIRVGVTLSEVLLCNPGRLRQRKGYCNLDCFVMLFGVRRGNTLAARAVMIHPVAQIGPAVVPVHSRQEAEWLRTLLRAFAGLDAFKPPTAEAANRVFARYAAVHGQEWVPIRYYPDLMLCSETEVILRECVGFSETGYVEDFLKKARVYVTLCQRHPWLRPAPEYLEAIKRAEGRDAASSSACH